MSRNPSFTKAQVRRALQAAESAGLRVTGLTIKPDGSIEINSGGKPSPAVDTKEPALAASWDDL